MFTDLVGQIKTSQTRGQPYSGTSPLISLASCSFIYFVLLCFFDFVRRFLKQGTIMSEATSIPQPKLTIAFAEIFHLNVAKKSRNTTHGWVIKGTVSKALLRRKNIVKWTTFNKKI